MRGIGLSGPTKHSAFLLASLNEDRKKTTTRVNKYVPGRRYVKRLLKLHKAQAVAMFVTHGGYRFRLE